VTLPLLRKADDITLRIQHDARERREKVGIYRELKMVCTEKERLYLNNTEHKPQLLNFPQSFVNI